MRTRNKITKQVEKEIQQICDQLSDEHYVISVLDKIAGKEAILTGFADKVDKTDLEKEYYFKVPLICKANHKRRIRKAFITGGDQGVRGYLENLFKKRTAEDTIDAPMQLVKAVTRHTQTL